MSTILAIETSSDACSVALSTPAGIVEDTVIAPREHTQRLLPMIENLLISQNMELSNIDAIAYGAGPGSFTGLRISLSVAQGLAYGAGLPLVSVSSLETMALTTLRKHKLVVGTVIIPAIDARMDEIYWCAYRVDSDVSVTELVDERVSAPEQCVDCLKDVTETCHKVGSGWRYATFGPLNLGFIQDSYPSAYDVAVIAQRKFEVGHCISPLNAAPTYLRNEVSWKKRSRIRA